MLRREAAARGISINDLLNDEITSKVAPVTPEEANAIYELRRAEYHTVTREDGLRLAATRLMAQRTGDRRAEYLLELHRSFEPQILLAPPRLSRVLSEGPTKGPDTALLTIIEFTDFQCPFCARVQPVLQQIAQNYAGRVRIIFRSLPLSIHVFAESAAEAAFCAGEQDRFWEMHDYLFKHQESLAAEDLQQHSRALGLDPARFQSCLASGRSAKVSHNDQAIAAELWHPTQHAYLFRKRKAAKWRRRLREILAATGRRARFQGPSQTGRRNTPAILRRIT